MALSSDEIFAANYRDELAEYLRTRSEKSLMRASDLSQIFVETGLGPEDVIALHFEALAQIQPTLSYRDQARAIGDAHQFLLETMITYGARYKDYLELKLQQAVGEAEARSASEREKVIEAERIEREAREILERITHELRSPITAVRGNLDLASKSLSKGNIEPANRYVGTAREAVERLSRLTADLVEASRGESTGLTLTTVDVSKILDQACDWAKVSAANKGVSLEYHPRQAPILATGNADALLSVFGNLLSNAVRYTPAGGKITTRVEVEDGWVCVEVSDTGIGMTPDVMARIFEKFYRAPQARGVDAQGLGLGLSLIQQMVVAHGGKIEVESEPERGSIFRIRIPIATVDKISG